MHSQKGGKAMKKRLLTTVVLITLFVPFQSDKTADAKSTHKLNLNGTSTSPQSIDSRWSEEDEHNEGHATHLWIVNRALDILSKTDDQHVSPVEAQMLSNWRANWEQGLYDADHINPYYNTATFSSHFYDPDTMKNWLRTSQTALTQGAKYFVLAGNYYKNKDREKAFYTLGLSLHYLTDVTQPMHAANFTWLNWPTSYHSKFEAYTESIQGDYAVQDGNGYWDWQDSNPEHWIHRAAVDAKVDFANIYTSDITKWFVAAATSNHYSDKWHQAVQPTIKNRLTEGQRITAGYIHLWFTTYVDLNGLTQTP